jgi:hypothetical protein
VSTRLPRGARRTACCAFVVTGCLALIGNPAAASQRESPSLRDRVRRLAEGTLDHRCFTPAIDGVFNQAVQNGAFQTALGTTFRIIDASSRDGRIGLTVAKPGGRAHTVTLATERIVGETPDDRAGDFLFYLQAEADAESSSVLLELARVLAERIPDTALVPCRSREEDFGTRAAALLSAAVAVLIVVAALLFGFRKLRHSVAA